MKKYLLIIGGITLLFFTALSANLFGFTDEAASSSSVYATWVSLLPPVIAIVLTLVTREVVLSLFAGLWIGTLLMASFNPDRKSTRLNSSHVAISYAVFCFKKKRVEDDRVRLAVDISRDIV